MLAWPTHQPQSAHELFETCQQKTSFFKLVGHYPGAPQAAGSWCHASFTTLSTMKLPVLENFRHAPTNQLCLFLRLLQCRQETQSNSVTTRHAGLAEVKTGPAYLDPVVLNSLSTFQIRADKMGRRNSDNSGMQEW
ncbi:hypothetical protein MIND_00798700 [Mycena indigotica]|uniref:Uncharacterized protein n=1 Tax=Mycena indigotica TaxID=2126181 RepID=A0A8H6SFE8_9AGAR|nr:uncharacterized protein MIND_00798700 [Mycena indigotica]KAF7298521.1 hypothetical protein MIND_00798700 [Mycena indigotica]